MRYTPINPVLFKQNRRRFAREMKPESIAIFHSNDPMPRTGDQFYPFKQNADTFYLSGIDQEETILVLFPGYPNENMREVAFIKKSTAKSVVWDGHKLSKEEARKASGLKKIYWLEDMEMILREMILRAKRIYVNGNENDRFSSEVVTRDQRFSKNMMGKYPFHKYHRAQPILKKLRMIKSRYEIEIMSRAAEITGTAFQKILGQVKPGISELEIEAQVISTFIAQGAQGHAYPPIIASGPAACILHYTRNDQICLDGNLILLDFGAEYANYAADLSRTIPANGQFNLRQKAVYESVLTVFKETKKMLLPGMTLAEINKEVNKMITYELIKLGLLNRADLKNIESKTPPFRKYFMHGVSHHIGMDVHDLSDRYIPFQAGMVLTCEPGLYLREEGIGVRIENDILITDNGPIDLMHDIPIEVEEIESLMHEQASI